MGTKFFGSDSSIFTLDFKKKKIYASSTERHTRLKHDWRDISYILKNRFKKKTYYNYVAQSFNGFKSKDTCFETKSFFIIILYLRKLLDIFKSSKVIVYKSNSNFLRNFLHTFAYYSSFLNKYFITKYIMNTLVKNKVIAKKILFYDHHLCHAASSYFFSDLSLNQEAHCLTLDGQGDAYFSKLFYFKNKKYQLLTGSKAITFYNKGFVHITSIGEIYSNFTEALGLIRNSDEGKTEALAAYGKKNKKIFDDLVSSYKIEDLSIVFKIHKIKKYYEINYLKKLIKKFGKKNIAATIQKFLEHMMIDYLNKVTKKIKIKNLCLSGGVFANVILNLRIYEKFNFEKIYIVPAMTDDGTSSGAAFLTAIDRGLDLSWIKKYKLPYFGDTFKKTEILDAIKINNNKIEYKFLGERWHAHVASSVIENKVVALFNGSMEYGPRALGNRSIIANAFNIKMRDILNLKVKRRAEYQPFCPSIIDKDRTSLFQSSYNHKFMTIAFRLKKRFWKKIPSMTHIDGTSRPQFVSKKDNKDFFKILTLVKKKLGFGVVINTSFNLHGRAMVRTPHDAIQDFLDCNIDCLYMGKFLITKNKSV